MRPPQDFILAALLPKLRLGGSGVYSELDTVLRQNVDETYFSGVHQHLFRCAVAATVAGTPLDEEVLASLLTQQGVPPTEHIGCQILLRDLGTVAITHEKLTVLLPQYRDFVHAQRMAQALEEAATILTRGTTVDGETVQGYREARHQIMQRLADLDRREQRTLPTKEVRDTATEILAEYQEVKKGREPGILTGFRDIDILTNGLQKGELAIFCAYTAEGKSQCLLNISWNAVVKQKKRGVFVSLEMPVDQVRRRLIARHTNHPRFGLVGGLDYTKIKQGKLDQYEEELFREVVADWQTNPDYGSLTVMQISKRDTVQVLGEKLMYLRSQAPIDFLALDYASLLSGSRRRTERRDEITGVIEDLKELCLTFNEGEGLCTYTANQISRKAREEADKLKRYGLSFASESSAIEKNADLLVWQLRLDEFKASREILMGVSKYRDGDVGSEFRLMEHFESSLLDNMVSGSTGWSR